MHRHLIENFYTASSFFIINYLARSPFLLVWAGQKLSRHLLRGASLTSRTKASATCESLPPARPPARPPCREFSCNVQFNSISAPAYILVLPVTSAIRTIYDLCKFAATLRKLGNSKTVLRVIWFPSAMFQLLRFQIYFTFFFSENNFCSNCVLQRTRDWFDVPNQYSPPDATGVFHR